MCSKLYAVLVLAFVNYSRANGDTAAMAPTQCARNLTTYTYDYTAMYPIEEIKNQNEIFFTFFVKAARDAHIIFSPDKRPAKQYDKAYEIILGSQGNKVSCIRTIRRGKDASSKKEANIVSDKEWRQFWIRINYQGLIEVGKGAEKSPFLSWKDNNRMAINHYGFASWTDKNVVNWAFPCSENPNLTRCTNYTAKSFDYNISYPITDKERDGKDIFLKFFIKGNRDALIVLSPTSNPIKQNGRAYEISIGGYKDLNFDCTSIRLERQSINSLDHVRICGTSKLSPDKWNHFWIRVSPDGLFQIGEKLGSDPFLVWKHERPMAIKSFGLASFKNSQVYFAFNCYK